MKFDPKNNWRKVVSLKLDTSCYQGLMKKLETNSKQTWSIKNYDFRFLRSEIQPRFLRSLYNPSYIKGLF